MSDVSSDSSLEFKSCINVWKLNIVLPTRQSHVHCMNSKLLPYLSSRTGKTVSIISHCPVLSHTQTTQKGVGNQNTHPTKVLQKMNRTFKEYQQSQNISQNNSSECIEAKGMLHSSRLFPVSQFTMNAILQRSLPIMRKAYIWCPNIWREH